MTNQEIPETMFDELIFNLYNNFVFSTFPYIVYKENSSISALNKYNSGNCIALSTFTCIYLKQNFGINAYVIPASVPRECKVQGTPHMSHCAVIIPFSFHEFFIFDGALYFAKPMYCNLKNNVIRKINLSDVYNHSFEEIEYIVRDCGTNIYLDKQFNQTLMKDTLCVSCWFSEDKTNSWNYYLNEIINPDDNIGSSFIYHKPLPFILYTEYDNCICKVKYKLSMENDGTITVKTYPEKKIIFKGNSVEFEKNPLRKKFQRYLSKNMIL
tara:strand:- start:626 stop:1432 length:807 start_codon:yes stop_codon:yes gene_type:complete